SIRDADVWPSEIEKSLRQASVIIVVIGAKWLTMSDKAGRRRIDLPGDWVCRELEVALTDQKTIYPLLIDGATIPEAEELPGTIASLTKSQFRTVSSDKLHKELDEIVSEISRIIKRDAIRSNLPFPMGGFLIIDALDE